MAAIKVNASRKVTMRIALVGLFAACAIAVAGVASSMSQAPPNDVYRVDVSTDRAPAGGYTEYVEPSTGRWVAESPGRRVVAGGGKYSVKDEHGIRVTEGSPQFLASAVEPAIALEAIRAFRAGRSTEAGITVGRTADGSTQLTFRRGHTRFHARIVDTLSTEDAERSGLFEHPEGPLRSLTREVPVGKPSSLGVPAYWFGHSSQNARATVAEDHVENPPAYELDNPRARARVHITSYGPREDPRVQVAVIERESGLAQATLKVFNGQNGEYEYPAWPRESITLASGEAAVVVPQMTDGAATYRPGFTVITEDAFIAVHVRIRADEIASFASTLRRVA